MSFLRKCLSWSTPTLIPKEHPAIPWLILANITIATLLGISSAIGVNVADPTITGALVIDSANTQWLTIAYLLMLGLCLPIAPWFAEKYGYKRVFFLGVLLFVIGSGFAGFAFDFYSLLFFRAIEGLGSGIFFPISLTILAQTFSGKTFGRAIAIYTGGGFGIGIISGVILGGYLSLYFYWQAVFFINIVFGIPSIIITWLIQQETEKKNVPRFNLFGYLSFCIFLAGLLTAVTIAKDVWNTEGWTSTLTLSCLISSLVGFVCLLLIEYKDPHPIINFTLFTHKTFTICSLAITFIGVILFGSASSFPIIFHYDLGYDNFTTGLMLLPIGIALAIVSPLAGLLAKKIDPKLLSLIGLILLTIFCFANHSLTLVSDHIDFIIALTGLAVGVGLSLGPITSLALSCLPPALQPSGSGIITFFRQMGAAFGGSVINLLIVFRQEFHNTIFGPQMNVYSPAYQKIAKNLTEHIIRSRGASPDIAEKQAYLSLVENAVAQSHILALNDAFLVFGIILAIFCLYFAIDLSYGIARKKECIFLKE